MVENHRKHSKFSKNFAGHLLINPSKFPDKMFELYSVPSFNDKKPEIIEGSEIGSSKHTVESDTVLLCKINPRINRVWVVGNYSDFTKIASTEWIPFFKIEGIFPSYLAYFMQNNKFKNFLSLNASGVGGSLMRIKKSKFIDYPFPLPPLPEQHRIVAKIEELFTRLDAGVKSLKKVKEQLKWYRQSVLKAAMEGKLTEEWRKQHKNELEPASLLLEKIKEERKKKLGKKYKELPPVDTEGLPEGWVWTKLENCIDILDSQRRPVNAKERGRRIAGKPISELYPYYGATGQVGWIDDYLFDEELILLGEDGAPFFELTKNKAYIVRGKSWVNNHAHVLRAIANITVNSFLCHYLNIFEYNGYVTGTTRPKLNQSRMREFPIPLPPLPEQHQIVSEIERRFSIIEEMEKTVEQGLKQAERLRQSILKRAFEGKLVPQNPDDEPASVLLERIKEEKARKEKETKTRKKTNSLTINHFSR